MSTYHFPIILGQNADERIVMIHITNDDDDYEENRVVACSGNQDMPLFKIPQDVELIDRGGNTTLINMGENFKVYNESAAGGRQELLPRKNIDDEYEFRVMDNDGGSFDGTIKFEYDNDIVGKLCIVRTSRVLNLNVDLGSEATQACSYSSLFETGTTEMVGIVDVLKDFYKKKGREYNQLVRETRQPLFTQEEAGSPYFYKTGNITFYYDETGTSKIGNLNTNDEDIEAWLDGSLGTGASTGAATDPAFINFLNVSAAGKNKNATKFTVWSDETKYTRKLINIKILYANMVRLGQYVANIDFKDDTNTSYTIANVLNLLEVLRSIYKQIIVSSIKAIDTKYRSFNLDNCDVISVLILVPNIYNQAAIDHLLYDLNKLNKPNKDQQKAQLRFDFRVISESDAAFLGIKEIQDENNRTILNQVTQGAKNERQKDLFLVIDSGKGTTDFSIIHYDPGNAVNPVFSVRRDGIAGAGGAIDYVFAHIVARQLYALSTKTGKCPKETFVDRFMSLLTMMSSDYQDKLMRVVERTKIEYDGEKIPEVLSCFPSVVIDRLLDSGEPEWSTITTDLSWQSMRSWKWSKSKYGTRKVEDEDKEEVKQVCRMIAETIIDKVFQKDKSLARGIDYVIFTGRSFEFKPLRDAFEKTLKGKRNFYEENMTVPYLEAGFYMLRRWFNKTILKKSSDKIEEQHANLHVAPMAGYSMKEISVQFTDHNLGCNCNSDLCCLNGLQIRRDGEYRFDMKKFWEGFTDGHNNKVYYLGYPGQSFTGNGVVLQQQPRKTKDENKLIDMTLFPVQYIPVDLESGGQQVGHNAESGDPQGSTNSVEDVDSFVKQ